MSVVPRPPGDLNDALRALGAQIATSLVAQLAGHPGWHTGWRGALQDAADLSQNDRGVLTVADEIHQAAHDLTTPAGVHVYAESTLSTIPEGPGRVLLRGMLEHLARRWNDAAAG